MPTCQDQCKRGEGEACGGHFGERGSCGRGLVCDIKNNGEHEGLCMVEPLEKQVTRLTDMNDQLLKKLNEKDKYMESKMSEKEDIIANLTKVNNQLERFMYKCNWCKCGCNTLPDGSTRCGAACTK